MVNYLLVLTPSSPISISLSMIFLPPSSLSLSDHVGRIRDALLFAIPLSNLLPRIRSLNTHPALSPHHPAATFTRFLFSSFLPIAPLCVLCVDSSVCVSTRPHNIVPSMFPFFNKKSGLKKKPIESEYGTFWAPCFYHVTVGVWYVLGSMF